MNKEMKNGSMVFLAAQYILSRTTQAYKLWAQGFKLQPDEWEWNFKDGCSHDDHKNPKNFPYVCWKGCIQIWHQSPIFWEAMDLLEDIGLIERHPKYESRCRYTGKPIDFQDFFQLDAIKADADWHPKGRFDND